DQITDDRQITQRLDGHLGLNRFPAGQNLAAVHSHGASAAHPGAANPAIGEVSGRVFGNPVQCVENAHPFAIGHVECVVPGSAILLAANAHDKARARRKAGIARRKRVVVLVLTEPAGAVARRCLGIEHHQATCRLSRTSKPGEKKGSWYGRCSKRRPLPDFFRTFATSQFLLSVAGKSVRMKGPRLSLRSATAAPLTSITC